jgi:UDP-N-acetylmuramoylalanine--D-glutamate ligase
LPSTELLGNLAGRSVTILGLAREGADLAKFLAEEGARVLATDKQPRSALGSFLAGLERLPVELHLGAHPIEEVLRCEVLFASPGISPETPILQEARRRGIPVSSATELFFARCPAPIIGITGSSGKSTTTALTGEILKASGRSVFVGGNIGQPLVGSLPRIGPRSLVVMELSSFQLETIDRSPSIATITNITPNHLDRHKTMAAYIAAKERIVRFQAPTDCAVLNADDPLSQTLRPPGQTVSFSLEGEVHGAFPRNGALWLGLGERQEEICPVDVIALRGRHNLANALTACATAAVAGADVEPMRAVLSTFQGLPHRLQRVGELRGVTFYNDSIATSPERSMAALASFREAIVLIAGGRDKDLPMDAWAQMIRQRVARVVLIGEAAALVRAALDRAGYPRGSIAEASSIPEAVQIAAAVAEPGGIVLLSPGCTSYDMFRDFEERGRTFATAVHDLMGQPG